MHHERQIVRQRFLYHVNEPGRGSGKVWKKVVALKEWSQSHLQSFLAGNVFATLIYLLIVANYACLGFVLPTYKGSTVYDVCLIIMYVLNSLFTLEIILRILAWGLLKPVESAAEYNRRPFLKDWRNYLDLALCITTFASPIIMWFSLLRILRFARPGEGDQLKAIQRFRFIISVLYVSFPSVLGAVAILFFYTLWWGVYGVALFGGRMDSSCYPPTPYFDQIIQQCWGNLTKCLELWPDARYAIVGLNEPCSTSSFLWTEGRTCDLPTLVCETRDALKLFGYNNCIFAMGQVWDILTGYMVWQKHLRGASAIGPQSWWWFVLPNWFGAFGLTLLISVLLLNAHRGVKQQADRLARRHAENSGDAAADHDEKLERRRQQRYLITGVIEHKAYRWGMLVVILLSMVFLLLDYDGVSGNISTISGIVNVVTWSLFVVEMLLKLVAYGWQYFYQPLNCLDFALVWFQMLGVIVYLGSFPHGNVRAWMDSLAALELLRLFRFIQFLPVSSQAKHAEVIFLRCWGKLLLLSVVHAIIIYGFSVAGVNLFLGFPSSNSVRLSWDGLWQAVVSTCTLGTGEAWNDLLNAMAQNNWSAWSVTQCVLYLIPLLGTCFYILPAIFWTTEVLHYEDAMAQYVTRVTAFNLFRKSNDSRNGILRRLFDKDFTLRGDYSTAEPDDQASLDRECLESRRILRTVPPSQLGKYVIGADNIAPRTGANDRITRLVIGRNYRWFTIVTILLHCSLIATIGYSLAPAASAFVTAGLAICLAIQGIQIVMEIHVYGLKPWVLEFWPVIGVLMWVMGIVGMFFPAFSGFVMLRLFVALRALRKGPRVQVLLRALLEHSPVLLTNLLLLAIMLITLAVMGVKLFKGKFFNCQLCLPDVNGNFRPWNCYTVSNANQLCDQASCEAPGLVSPISGAKFVWAVETNNFDNAFNSIVSLMRVAIPSAWNSLMYNAMDAQDVPDKCMVPRSNPGNAAFFLFAVVILQYITFPWLNAVLAYVVCVVRLRVRAFDTLDERQQTYLQLTTFYADTSVCDPDKYPYIAGILTEAEAEYLPDILRAKVSAVVSGYWYQPAWFVLDVVHFALLCVIWAPNQPWHATYCHAVGIAFATMWALDAVAKMVVVGGIEPYLKTQFYCFELIALCADLTIFVLGWVMGFLLPFGLVRLSRLLHEGNMAYVAVFSPRRGLLRFFDVKLHPSLRAISALLWGVLSVIVLYCIILAMIAVFCVDLYKGLPEDGIVISQVINFQNFFNSFIATNNMAITDYWTEVLNVVKSDPPFCDPSTSACKNITTYILPVFTPLLTLLTLGLVYTVVYDVALLLEVDRTRPTSLFTLYTMAWKRFDGKRHLSMPVKRFLLLWRYLQILREDPQLMHVGVDEYLGVEKSAAWYRKLRFSVLFWPVSANRRIYFNDGLGALVCSMAKVGYGEHCLLQRLMHPAFGPDMDFFFMVIHWRVNAILEDLWAASAPFRAQRERNRNREAVRKFDNWRQDWAAQQELLERCGIDTTGFFDTSSHAPTPTPSLTYDAGQELRRDHQRVPLSSFATDSSAGEEEAEAEPGEEEEGSEFFSARAPHSSLLANLPSDSERSTASSERQPAATEAEQRRQEHVAAEAAETVTTRGLADGVAGREISVVSAAHASSSSTTFPVTVLPIDEYSDSDSDPSVVSL
eukprot:EG_transcript_193